MLQQPQMETTTIARQQPFSHKQLFLLLCNDAGGQGAASMEKWGRIEAVSCGASPGTSLKSKPLVDEGETVTNLNYCLHEMCHHGCSVWI